MGLEGVELGSFTFANNQSDIERSLIDHLGPPSSGSSGALSNFAGALAGGKKLSEHEIYVAAQNSYMKEHSKKLPNGANCFVMTPENRSFIKAIADAAMLYASRFDAVQHAQETRGGIITGLHEPKPLSSQQGADRVAREVQKRGETLDALGKRINEMRERVLAIRKKRVIDGVMRTTQMQVGAWDLP